MPLTLPCAPARSSYHVACAATISSRVLAVSLILAPPHARLSAQAARYVLTSAEHNIDVGDWQIGARETGIAPDAKWSVRRERLHGGKQDDVDLIVIDNGRMTITLVPTRGMGILRVVSGDMRLGWDSPVHEVVHPKVHEPRSTWRPRVARRVQRVDGTVRARVGRPSRSGSIHQQSWRAGRDESDPPREGRKYSGVRSGGHRGA